MRKLVFLFTISLLCIASFISSLPLGTNNLTAQAFATYQFDTYFEFETWLSSVGKTAGNIDYEEVLSDGGYYIVLESGEVITIKASN